MSSLDIDTITQLLKEGDSKTISTPKVNSNRERPIQLGPLSYYEETFRCVRKQCTAPTSLKVNDIPYCGTHALYALNNIIMKSENYGWVFEACDCNTGKFSMECMHNESCATFGRLKEQRDNSSI